MLTYRQQFLKFIYPFFMRYTRYTKRNGFIFHNPSGERSRSSFHQLNAISNRGKDVSMEVYKGKKILIVNVASNCGFTNQYKDLELLYKSANETIVVLGFPANDFNQQEEGDDIQIERFCQVNYGITFPLFKKQSVLKPNQNQIYQWLTDKSQNGWNNQEPTWNFCKYVIDEEGTLQAVFGPAISPDHRLIKKALGIR